MTVKYILTVAAGGAIGAVLRYMVSLIPFKGSFPTATFAVNILGAFILGFIAGAAAAKGIPHTLQLFLKTGICGGFTTFSTFSLESAALFQNGRTAMAVCYISASLFGALAFVFLGQKLGKSV